MSAWLKNDLLGEMINWFWGQSVSGEGGKLCSELWYTFGVYVVNLMCILM